MRNLFQQKNFLNTLEAAFQAKIVRLMIIILPFQNKKLVQAVLLKNKACEGKIKPD